ncbi:MAG: nitroreductase/quinone reductase family protein [Anaerolineae bacterium]
MAETAQTQEQTGPPLPPWMFTYIVNPLMRLILRSPLHGMVSERLLLLTYTGHKSGKKYTIPVGYTRENGTLYVLTHSPWWRNFQQPAEVRVRLQGEMIGGTAEVVSDIEAVIGYIRSEMARDPEMSARRFGLELEEGEHPDRSQLETAARGGHLIAIDLHE